MSNLPPRRRSPVHRTSIARLMAGLLLAAATTATAPRLAGAAEVTGDDLIDTVEHLLGTTNIGAIAGHGRLSIGVSRDGDLTVLAWPTPSFADQLGYITSNALDARARPRFGAAEGAGMFFGLVLDLDDASRRVVFLRDRSVFTIVQDHGVTDGPNIETRFESKELGLSVVLTDAVRPPDAATVPAAAGVAPADLMVRRIQLSRSAQSPVVSAHLVTYANLSPLPPDVHLPELPILDWGLDGRNDFAALWDQATGAVVHFHPGDQLAPRTIAEVLAPPPVDYGPAGTLLLSPTVADADVANLARELDSRYAPGAYLALTTLPAPEQHQVGFDATPFCDNVDEIIDNLRELPTLFPGFQLPLDPNVLEVLRCNRKLPSTATAQGWQATPRDALTDITAGNGELSGASLAAGEVSSALRTPFDLPASGAAQATVSVLLSAAATADEARGMLDLASPDAVVEAAETAGNLFIKGLRLPGNLLPLTRRVARRALLNLRVGTHVDTGAIVASISRQPPYGLDWPRDGMFFNVALDVSGQSELAERRTQLSASWQRLRLTQGTPLIDPPPPTDPVTGEMGYPAYAWEMNYYPDGKPGGMFRFEIDNTAFAITMLAVHAGWADDPKVYLTSIYDTLKRGTDLLAGWRDAESGLHAPAQEDDNAAYTQTLHGAVTVFGALDLAARAARLLGKDEDALAWETRATELRQAIFDNLIDPDTGLFISTSAAKGNPGSAPTGPTAWLVWPCQLLDWSDPRVRAQLESDLAAIRPSIELTTGGGAYVLKNMVSLALVLGRDPEVGPVLTDLLDRLAASTTPTQHFGEVFRVVEGPDGKPLADQRVATPHLWEGTLFYLTTIALEDPEALLAYDRVLPASRVRAPAPADGGPDGQDDAGPAADAGRDSGPGGDTGGQPDSGGCSCATAGPAATPRGAAEGLPAVLALLFLVAVAWRRAAGRP